jgi:CTP:molybdopterin cytidylyltransferase MocA
MPLVSGRTVRRLVASAIGDGALVVDGSGSTQYLCAAYSVASLQRVRAGLDDSSGHGISMRRFVAGLRLAELPDTDDETHDLDTWDDLVALRRRVDERDGS